MLRYSLRQLEYFRAVAESRSVADAARALNVSQPSISAAIAKLEDQLGVQLFIRQHARGMQLTPAGQRLAGQARNLLRHAEELQRHATSGEAELSGELNLGSFMTLAPVFMPGLISRFRARHPGVSIKLTEGDQGQLFEGLRSGRFELALIYSLVVADDLVVTPLSGFTPYALLPAGHRLAQQDDVSLHELACEPMILFDVEPSKTYFLGLFAAEGLMPAVAFSSPSLELVRGMVGRGEGFSVLVTRPPGDVSYDRQPLAVRPIRETVEPGRIALVRHADLRSNHLMDAFTLFARDYFRQLKDAAADAHS